MWCIYKHTSPSNKVYIGMTRQDPSVRWRNGSGYSTGTKFSKAIIAHGWDNFTHEIIEDNIPTLEEAIEREKYWIAEYDSFRSGYNSTTGGDGISPDLIVKIPVYQLDENFEIIAEYDSYLDAAENTGISNNHICSVINNRQITAGGYYWCKVEDYYDGWRPRADGRSRPVICIETQVIYPTQTEAARDMGINNQESISYCCLRQGITAGGYHWAFADEYDDEWKPLEPQEKDFSDMCRPVICIETGEVYKSVSEASRENLISRSSIRRACAEQRTANNKHFAYLDEYDEREWQPHINRRSIEHLAKAVVCIETGDEYYSTREAGRILGIPHSLISRCCNGLLDSTHNLHFKYKEN